MKSNRKRIGIFSIFSVVIMISILLSITIYSSYITENVEKSAEVTLNELIEQQAFNFVSKLKADTQSLKMAALTVQNTTNFTDWQLDAFKNIVAESSFQRMLVLNIDGKGISSIGIEVNISDKYYFIEALAGETVVSQPTYSPVYPDQIVIIITTPIYKNNQIIGVLAGSYLLSELEELFLSSFSGKGYSYIVTNEGGIIAKTASEYLLTKTNNTFDMLKEANFYDGDNFNTIHKNFINNKPGKTKFEYNGQKRMMQYMPININDWNLISVIPDEVISHSANQIIWATIILSFFILGIIFVLVLFMNKVRRNNFEKIQEIAFVDSLTKAATLAKFKLDGQQLLENNKDITFIIAKFDILNFKMINRLYGYDTGDKLLTIVVDTIKSEFKEEIGLLTRANADEFFIIARYNKDNPINNETDLYNKNLEKALIKEVDHKIYLPVGIYSFKPEDVKMDILVAIERVNFAHSEAKRQKVLMYPYNEEAESKMIRMIQIERRMEVALDNSEFMVYLQPKYDLLTEEIEGAEALARWKDCDNNFIYPNEFIPLFEENGFITKFDFYMFEKVCNIIQVWMSIKIKPIVISVNFSRLHLMKKDFVDTLIFIADKYNVPHNYLEIELTESVVFQNEEILIDVLNQLHIAGFTLSVDDFGTGYSSLGLLKNMPIDTIKIDKSFFTAAQQEERARLVISNIIHMAKEIGIRTVAEGIETKDTVDLLKQLGCDMVQGYYYGKAIPDNEFTDKMIKKKSY